MSCTGCPRGYEAGRSSSSCTRCSSGKQQVELREECKNCPAGTYGEDGTSCEECPSGYISVEGSRDCRACSAGKFLDPATATCVACPAGYAQASPGGLRCEKCGADAYAPRNASAAVFHALRVLQLAYGRDDPPRMSLRPKISTNICGRWCARVHRLRSQRHLR